MNLRLLPILPLLIFFSFSPRLAAQADAEADAANEAASSDEGQMSAGNAAIPTLDTLVVSGIQPGPGLWKVSKGDNVLWLLGTLTPLPRRMEWNSLEVERAIARSAEVIVEPTVKVDAGVGMIRGMFLLPSLLGARKNPDGATLKDVLPADLYARWLPLKAKYLGRDAGVEKWRPVFAALELYSEAIEDSGLDSDSPVTPLVEKTAGRHDIPITRPRIEVKFSEPKAAIKQFSRATLEDGDCFAKTLLRLETDIDAMRARANAWAVGDITALRQLPYSDQNQTCRDALLNSVVVRERGMQDLPQRARAAWLQAVESALSRNRESLAVVRMSEILKADGYLAALVAKGYAIEAPEEVVDDSTGD